MDAFRPVDWLGVLAFEEPPSGMSRILVILALHSYGSNSRKDASVSD